MTSSNYTVGKTLDDYIIDRSRDTAFAEALRLLFIQNPLPEHAHDMHRVVRVSALRKARAGGYAGSDTANILYWRKQVEENAREDWNVPSDEVVAIHMLVYG